MTTVTHDKRRGPPCQWDAAYRTENLSSKQAETSYTDDQESILGKDRSKSPSSGSSGDEFMVAVEDGATMAQLIFTDGQKRNPSERTIWVQRSNVRAMRTCCHRNGR